jgi:hypothetical protein
MTGMYCLTVLEAGSPGVSRKVFLKAEKERAGLHLTSGFWCLLAILVWGWDMHDLDL